MMKHSKVSNNQPAQRYQPHQQSYMQDSNYSNTQNTPAQLHKQPKNINNENINPYMQDSAYLTQVDQPRQSQPQQYRPRQSQPQQYQPQQY